MSLRSIPVRVSATVLHALVLAVLCASLLQLEARGQTAPVEKVGRGGTSSVAIDGAGNLHVVYLTANAQVWYAFRPRDSKKWFNIEVVESTHSIQNIYPRVAVDTGGRPHICVATGELKYVALLDDKWVTQVVDPGSGTLSYHCSIALSAEGIPHLSWYHEYLPDGRQFTHVRHADLENGIWIVRSIDGGIAGKWNSMALDDKGYPHLSYSQISYGGALRYASWNGKDWEVSDVDSSHGSSPVAGFDNSLALGAGGSEHISYFDDKSLKYAHRSKGKWSVETVAGISPGYNHYTGSTTMLLDKNGDPHIIYSDVGEIRHAFRRADKWQTETIISGGIQQYPNVDAAMGEDGTLYVSYPDPEDGVVKLATIKPVEVETSTEKAGGPQKY
jgi:hypothetical protein